MPSTQEKESLIRLFTVGQQSTRLVAKNESLLLCIERAELQDLLQNREKKSGALRAYEDGLKNGHNEAFEKTNYPNSRNYYYEMGRKHAKSRAKENSVTRDDVPTIEVMEKWVDVSYQNYQALGSKENELADVLKDSNKRLAYQHGVEYEQNKLMGKSPKEEFADESKKRKSLTFFGVVKGTIIAGLVALGALALGGAFAIFPPLGIIAIAIGAMVLGGAIVGGAGWKIGGDEDKKHAELKGAYEKGRSHVKEHAEEIAKEAKKESTAPEKQAPAKEHLFVKNITKRRTDAEKEVSTGRQ